MAGDLGQLKSVDWDKLQRYADRLESAWQNVAEGQAGPDLQQYLPLAGDPLRVVVLHELVKTEIEIRWRRGLPTSLDHYLERLPELGKAQDLPAALVFEEFRVRQQYGDKPPLAAYKVRFPNQFAELEKLHNEDPRPTAAMPPAGDQPTPPMSKVVAEVKREATVTPQSTVASGGTVLPGGYRLIKRIGSGTFGEVWRADAPGGVPVAVKIVIRPVDADEAQRELHAMELIKLLQHPYLLQTHRFEIFEDRLYIVMELADGSLRDRLKQRRKEGKGGIPVGELLRYFRESAEALDFLHSEKVLHRDIKPENILLLKGHAKVADFGLARGQGSGQSMFSATGCGTPAYMAPEVWRGKVSANTDQYSLAVAYAELRLDRRLFAGGDFMAVMMSHLEKTPDLAPLSEAEQKVLFKSMSKDPTKRYPNCMAWAEALEEALAPELGRSTLLGRQPTPSVQELRAAESGELGTVGRGNLPSRQGSSGDKTEQWRGGEKPRSFIRSVLLLLTVFVPLAAAAWYFLPRHNGVTTTLQLRSLPAIDLHAGDERPVTLNIDRRGIQDPIKILFPDAITGLKTSTANDSVGPGVDSVRIKLEAEPDAQPGPRIVTVRAEAGDLHDTKTMQVEILPLKTLALLPTGCERDPNAKILTDGAGRLYYSKVLLVKNGLRIPFLAIPNQKGPKDPPTFYIMENKVSNDLMLEASKDKAFQELLATQLKLEPKIVKDEWRTQGGETSPKVGEAGKSLGSSDGKLPVMRVTVVEAHTFAAWLGGLLPTTQQWDKASGRFEPKRWVGPFKGSKVAVRQSEDGPAGPMHVGLAADDKSEFGCRDMAGNGREWTRNLTGSIPKTVPLSTKSDTLDSVILRGRSYLEDKPLHFADVDSRESGGQVYDSEAYLSAVADIGFRVVLELK